MPAPSEAVWVTVDDFGMSASANRHIVALAEQGRLSAVSVMAHGSAQLDGLDALLATPVAIGAHLTFTGGRSLVGDRALSRAWWGLTARVATRPASVRALIDEATRQADRLAGRCGRVDFVNSHEHVHLLPALWPGVVDLALAFRASAIRMPTWPPRGTVPEQLLAAVAHLAARRRALPPSLAITVPVGVLRAGRLAIDDVERAVSSTPASGTHTELCFHPASERGVSPELALLESGTVDEVIARAGRTRAHGVDPARRS